ncbi:hypothetical protein BH09PSE6_BH09PSE6_12950 [soil metagenome]
MKRLAGLLLTAMLLVAPVTVPVASAAEPGVFIDLKDVPLPEAAAFVARITSHRIELGPGAEGRITMSTPRALTYDEVLVQFDEELARNGLTAIKRGRAMLIVTATPVRRLAEPSPLSFIVPNQDRARALIQRLQGGGVAARMQAASSDAEDGYAIEIAVPADPAARRDLAAKIAALDLSALFVVQP